MNKILLSILCAAALAACSKTETEAAPAEPAAPTASKPVYHVAAELDAPFTLAQADGSLIGFDVDVLNAIAERQGFVLEIKSYPWKVLFDTVERGEADLTAGGIYVTPARQEKFDYSETYLTTGTALLAQNSLNIKNVEDIRGKTIAVKARTQAERWAKHTLGTQTDNLHAHETLWLAFKEGMSKKADVTMGDRRSLQYFSKSYPDLNMTLMPVDSLPTEQYAFMIRRGQPELLEKLNAGLAQIKQDGTLDKLIKKWFEDVKPSKP